MDRPDFEQARNYAFGHLERELPATFRYHSFAHTRDEVLPAAERFAAIEAVDEEAMLLLRTAACYHDLGFVEQPFDNEAIGARIAAAMLPGFGYSPAQIGAIAGLIMATKIPQSPHSLLEEIMADADLSVVGQTNFLLRNADLRVELAALGKSVSDATWYSSQLQFLRGHRYFTAAARALCDATKQENIAAMARLLVQCQILDPASG